MLKKIRSIDFAVIFCIIAVYIFLGWMGISCPIHFLTGISCAGCGMTRAWFAFLHLDLAGAFSYHPLFWLPLVCLLFWLFSEKIPEKVYRGFWISCCGLFLVVYVIRLTDLQDTVVTFDLKSSLPYQLAQKILSFF